MNKHILLVMKWLNDKESVTQEALNDNRTAANAASDAFASYAAANAANAAYADDDAAAVKWVTKYFERTGENKQDYIDALTVKAESPVFTQEMADNGVLPSVGMECEVSYEDHHYYKCEIVAHREIQLSTEKCMVAIYLIKDHKGESSFYSHCPSDLFKPLTPPITLIDGKAYQFINIEDNTIHGIYDEDEHSFRGTCVEWGANSCTNIKPLTVER